MDASLLEGLMTSTKDGLHLLAAPQQPYAAAPAAAELARLFDLLVSHYRYVIVDCSGRMDQTTRLLSDLSNAVLMVAQTTWYLSGARAAFVFFWKRGPRAIACAWS